MLCIVVVMQSFIMNSHEVFIHIYQGCFAGTGAIVRLPECQWSKPDGYGKISQCITTTKHSKAKTVCIFLGIYCSCSGRDATDWVRQCCPSHKDTASARNVCSVLFIKHNLLLSAICRLHTCSSDLAKHMQGDDYIVWAWTYTLPRCNCRGILYR